MLDLVIGNEPIRVASAHERIGCHHLGVQQRMAADEAHQIPEVPVGAIPSLARLRGAGLVRGAVMGWG